MMENMWVHRVWSSDPNLYIPIFLLQFRHYNTHCLYNVYTTHSTSILYYPIYYSPTSHLIVCCCISPPNSHPHTTGSKAATRPQPHTVPDPSNPYVRIYIYKYIHSTTYIWPIYYLYFGLYCPTGKKTKKNYIFTTYILLIWHSATSFTASFHRSASLRALGGRKW